MKTAISIPDAVFEAAEELAERLGKSRSQLYAEAIAVYLRTHREEGVTARLDRIYAEQPSDLDPAVRALQARSLPDEDW